MAVYKRLTCAHCGKVRQIQQERPKGEACPCGMVANIYSKMWSVSVYIGGEKHTESSVARLKADALAREAELMTRATSGELITRPTSMTLKESVETFQLFCTEQVANKAIDWKTERRYISALETNVLRYMGNINISRIDHLEVDQYVRQRMSDVPKPTPATVNRELTALSRLLTIMVRKRVLSRNMMEGYPKLKEPKTRERCLTAVEIQRLLAACADKSAPKYLRTMVVVALNTGLRKDGVLGLRWEHIDWENNTITRQVKAEKIVRVPMSGELRTTLQAWRKAGPVNIGGWVFPSPKKPKKPMLVSSNIGFDAAVERAKLGDLVFHQLRHVFISHLIMQTKNIQLAADIAGHSTIWITQRYTHLLEDFKQEAMKGFKL